MSSQLKSSISTLTPAQEQARAVLLKLPAELVYHFWGIVLHQDNSYENFITVLQYYVPELAWSVQIITDDVQRLSSKFTGGKAPRIISLTKHEQELENRSDIDQCIITVAVLSDCDNAVLSGGLTAYEGCRYGRLLLDCRVDISYCLVLPRHRSTAKTQVEEMLHKFKALASGKVHIVKVPQLLPSGVQVDDIKRSSASWLETKTMIRSSTTGKPLDYRVVLSEGCDMQKVRTGNARTPLTCVPPTIRLTYDQLAPQVHISFRSSRTPIIAYSESESHRGLREQVDSRAKEFEPKEPSTHKNTLFSITNLNWSFTTPGGSSGTCPHMHGGAYELYPLERVSLMDFTGFYERLWLYGVSDSTMLAVSSFIMREVVWFRLSPHNFWPLEPCAAYAFQLFFYLKRLALFSELTERYHDLTSIPKFFTSAGIDCVQLVSLANSDQPWYVDKVLLTYGLLSLESLELLQLRASSAKTSSQPYLNIGWENIGSVVPIVQELTIGGYLPEFALPEYATPSSTNATVFSHLRLLCLDVSALAFRGGPCYKLCFPKTLYPSLKQLYLKGSIAMSMEWDTYPSVTLSKTCKVLGLSSVIRTKVEVNGKLLKVPEIPVNADVFNFWHVSRITGAFRYAGAGHEAVTRRIEEVDEKLRPI